MKTILLSIWMMISLVSHAQKTTTGFDFKNLLNDTVSITATGETDAYYWIGTRNGLYCIRKKNKKVSHLTSKNSVLPSDIITCLTVKNNGEVYAGTHEGIMRYDNFSFLLINKENSSLLSNNITSLACINGDEIFAGTIDSGITMFAYGRSKNITKSNASLPNNHIVSFEKTGENEMLVVMDSDNKVLIHNHEIKSLKAIK